MLPADSQGWSSIENIETRVVVGGFESHPISNANRDLKRTEAIVMGFIAFSTDDAAVVERDTCYITFQSSVYASS